LSWRRIKRLKDLERENATPKRILADAELKKIALTEIATPAQKAGQSITRKCNAFGANKGFVDERTRESSAAMVERSITGQHLIGELSRLATERETFPAVLRCDEGLELGGRAMADWSSGQVGLLGIPPD